MRPGFQPRSPSPAGWALLTLVTEDAGKCLAGGIGQYLPVFCWGLPADHVASIILGCLAAVLFVLRAGMVCRATGRGSWQGEGKVVRQIAPNPIPKTSQASQESSALLGEANVLSSTS